MTTTDIRAVLTNLATELSEVAETVEELVHDVPVQSRQERRLLSAATMVKGAVAELTLARYEHTVREEQEA